METSKLGFILTNKETAGYSRCLVSYEDTRVKGLVLSHGKPWWDERLGKYTRDMQYYEKETITHTRSGYLIACIWDDTNNIDFLECRRKYLRWLLWSLETRDFDQEAANIQANKSLLEYVKKTKSEWWEAHNQISEAQERKTGKRTWNWNCGKLH